MDLVSIIIFGFFTMGYSFMTGLLNDWKFNLKNHIKKKRYRIPVIMLMFCIAVYFQVQFSDSEVLSINTFIVALLHGVCLSLLIRFTWTKNFD